MDAETIVSITHLAQQGSSHALKESLTLDYDGNPVSYEAAVDPTENGRKLGAILKPFRPAKLEVTTLTGFLDAIAAGVAGPLDDFPDSRIIHVENYLKVSVRNVGSDKYGVRDTLLEATHTPVNSFKFDEYYNDPQRFIIALQTAFLPTEELLYVLKIASNLKAGKTLQVNDDGFGQTVTLQAGEVKTVDVAVQPRIKLIPIRTFPEANKVESEFLIRFKQSQQETPMIALFDVEGNKWQGEVMRSIKDYLSKALANPNIPILA